MQHVFKIQRIIYATLITGVIKMVITYSTRIVEDKKIEKI